MYPLFFYLIEVYWLFNFNLRLTVLGQMSNALLLSALVQVDELQVVVIVLPSIQCSLGLPLPLFHFNLAWSAWSAWSALPLHVQTIGVFSERLYVAQLFGCIMSYCLQFFQTPLNFAANLFLWKNYFLSLFMLCTFEYMHVSEQPLSRIFNMLLWLGNISTLTM